MATAATTSDAAGGAEPAPRSLTACLSAAALAVWGAVTGVLPHRLHHVGPLAGAAVLAGATGKLVFGVIGLVAAIPFLRRLYRRFNTWRAPAIALGVLVAAFAVSTLVIGPAISASDSNQPAKPDVQQPAGHASHHSR